MDEKIKDLIRRIFNLEKDNIVQYELLKEFHYELFKIKMNLTILNWLVISYILYQVIFGVNNMRGKKMFKKVWDNIEIILITLSMLLAMFTIGLIVGVYVSSNTIEELSNDNIVKERTIQEQKERIRELQMFKQLKEIYG